MIGKFAVLSHFQAEDVLLAKKKGETKVKTSLDLGMTKDKVKITKKGIETPENQLIAWKQLKKIKKDKNKCYVVDQGKAHAIVLHSEKTDWVRTLYPTEEAPTSMVSGNLMHQIKKTKPFRDSWNKVELLMPLHNAFVLDTSMGLGYTAILAAKEAEKVITFDIDPAAVDICKLNPWSQNLFEYDNIEIVVADITEKIIKINDRKFTHILHDPPNIRLAGDPYSLEFYKELYRVLKRKGKIFHYIGDPESELGDKTTKGVVKRLKQAGFKNIQEAPKSFGVVASK